MLQINKIIIKNFRPYYGIQTFDFGTSDGLSIVMGDNGVGKTSLILAIKFVLYDEFYSEGNFKIKNELNVIAWEEQNYELYVGMEFTYNNNKYILKRIKRTIANIVGEPISDADFESHLTLQKDGNILSYEESNIILKNIIPKKISEYILFEGETINKYKDLLDHNKNLEIFESIKKILGVTILENSKMDLEKQYELFNLDKEKQLKEQNRNQKWLDELEKYNEEKNSYDNEKEKAIQKKNDLDKEIIEIEKYLKTHQRIKDLMEKKKNNVENLNETIQIIKNEKNKINQSLKKYKSFIYPIIKNEIKNIPPEIIKIKDKIEKNKIVQADIDNYNEVMNSVICKFCKNDINDTSKIKESLDELESKLLFVSEDEALELSNYNHKISILDGMSEGVDEINLKEEIFDIEGRILSEIIKSDRISDTIKNLDEQIYNSGGSQNMDQKIEEYKKAVANQILLRKTIKDCEESIRSVKIKIESLLKKNPTSIDVSKIDAKLIKTKNLIEIFDTAINKYSIIMRKRVQDDATIMFKRISDSKEYSHLEFDEQYGLKLMDVKSRIVPNISSGYMTLITISLIYGLHKNSSLTGTIILDAPFSVLTNVHRDNIIKTFQELSPQVLLFVYKDQINMESINKAMKDKLVTKYEIYQDKSQNNYIYKTNVRRV